MVALVVVLDGVGKIDDIGRVLLKRVAEFDSYFLAHCADERLGSGGWRDNDLLLLVLEIDDFIKGDLHLLAFEVNGT